MDFALSSSTVLGAAVLLWLLWVAPYLLRRRRAVQPAGEASMLMDDGAPGASGAAPAHGPPASSEGGPGRPAGGPSAPARPEAPSAPPSSSAASGTAQRRPATTGRPPRLRIRWGRLVVAVLGLVALVACPVTLVLVAFGAPAIIPAGCAASAATAVAVLRSLAVRDRRRKVDAAFSTAMRGAPPAPASSPQGTGASEVYDATFAPEPAPRPLSREELRAAALEVARASQASAEEAAKATGQAEETWEPVGVPKPSYVDAARAERPEPEPLEAPEEPKPTSKTAIKPKAEAPEPGTVPGVPTLGARPAGRPTGALGNLDAVLQRRRA